MSGVRHSLHADFQQLLLTPQLLAQQRSTIGTFNSGSAAVLVNLVKPDTAYVVVGDSYKVYKAHET